MWVQNDTVSRGEKNATKLQQQSNRCSKSGGKKAGGDTALRMRVPSRCGSHRQGVRIKLWRSGQRLVTRRRDARVGRLGPAWSYACAARMDQEEASAPRPVRWGRWTYASLRAWLRTHGCSPRERERRARYACARELGARGTEAERRRRGGGGRAPLRYRA